MFGEERFEVSNGCITHCRYWHNGTVDVICRNDLHGYLIGIYMVKRYKKRYK